VGLITAYYIKTLKRKVVSNRVRGLL